MNEAFWGGPRSLQHALLFCWKTFVSLLSPNTAWLKRAPGDWVQNAAVFLCLALLSCLYTPQKTLCPYWLFYPSPLNLNDILTALISPRCNKSQGSVVLPWPPPCTCWLMQLSSSSASWCNECMTMSQSQSLGSDAALNWESCLHTFLCS